MKYLALLASSTTLICCALPALLVFFGFGAVMASLVATLPMLVTLSEYKLVVFTISAILIVSAWFVQRQAKSCPIGEQKENCARLKSFSHGIILVSATLWCIGFATAFILPRLLA